jgi:pyruvate,water dikinase
MVRAGFPVPPHFIITTVAYRAFIAANDLQAQIEELGRVRRSDDVKALETASRTVRGLFDQGSIPKGIVQEIIDDYRYLAESARSLEAGAPGTIYLPAPTLRTVPSVLHPLPVAVRSSANAEDLPEASFAGQQETFLNVCGEESLMTAVRRCWSSLWTARAMTYRMHQGIDPTTISLAVVVQQMIAAEVAGVLFTANPLTGNRDEVFINAAWGLGDAIVGGQVTPDTLIVDKNAGRVKQVTVEDKAVMSIMGASGTTETPVEPRRRRQTALTPEQAVNLTRLGCAIEDYFGAPQDIEWALAGETICILQSRPVVARGGLRPPTPAEESAAPGDDRWPAWGEKPAQSFDLWTMANLGEVWPHPVSPLMWSGVPGIVSDGNRYILRGLKSAWLDDIQWAKRFYGRVFYNEGALAYLLSQELGLPGTFVDVAWGSRRHADQKSGRGFRPARLLSQFPFLLRLARSQMEKGEQLKALFVQIDSWMEDFNGRSFAGVSDQNLFDEFLVWMGHLKRSINLQFEMSGLALTSFALLERLLDRWLERKDLAQTMITGLSGIYAADMGPALWGIAQTLRRQGLAEVVLENEPRQALTCLRGMSRAQPFVEALDSFLRRHGHRCPNEGEWLLPRWADAPEQIVEMIAGYLRAGGQIDPTETSLHQARRREEAEAWAADNLDFARRRLFRYVLARTQSAVRLRDNGKSYYMKVMFPMRRIGVLFGERWTRLGWLREPEDIFFLTLPDVERILQAGDPAAANLDLPALVAARRRSYEYWFEVEAPEVIGADGRPVTTDAVSDATPDVLRGIAASGGRVRGTARIIHDPQEAARLRPGSIMVTRATDPGWTPLFFLVAGMVLEVGGQLSHASIVARELGLPSVVNVPHATSAIRDGQTITVDGTTGRVYLHEAGDESSTEGLG